MGNTYGCLKHNHWWYRCEMGCLSCVEWRHAGWGQLGMVDELGSGFHAAQNHGCLEHNCMRQKLGQLVNQSQRLKTMNVSFQVHLWMPKSPEYWARMNLFNLSLLWWALLVEAMAQIERKLSRSARYANFLEDLKIYILYTIRFAF